MKRKIINNTCIAAFLCITVIALAGGSLISGKAMVEEMLRKRTSIIENVLSGQISLEEGKEKLRGIEEGKLYTDDIKILNDFINVEHDKVIGMDIISLDKRRHVADTVSYEAVIEWTYKGKEKIYVQTYEHYIGLIENNSKYKLVSMEVK